LGRICFYSQSGLDATNFGEGGRANAAKIHQPMGPFDFLANGQQKGAPGGQEDPGWISKES